MTITVVRDALQHLVINDGKALVDTNGTPFDTAAYSRMKYGDAKVARDWGVALARHFVANHPRLAFDSRRVIVTGPSYKYLSTAAQGVAEAFSTVFNSARVVRGLEPSLSLHIIRAWVGSDSYAMASMEERARQLPAGGQHVDHGLIQGSVVIVIDDVSITGTTERAIQAHIEPAEPAALCFLHVADVDQEQALANSAIEDAMNKMVAPTLDTFRMLVMTGNMRLNSRVFRTIMETSTTDPAGLVRFMRSVPDHFLMTMYDALVGGTVEMFERYPLATGMLRRELLDRNLYYATMIAE